MAAEAGYHPSQSNLGVCYETGKGVQKDLTQAIKWYLRAALGGNQAGKTNIARMEAISLPACYQALAGLVGELMRNESEVRPRVVLCGQCVWGIVSCVVPWIGRFYGTCVPCVCDVCLRVLLCIHASCEGACIACVCACNVCNYVCVRVCVCVC